eukprot:CAMPEP_0196587274 /NCGR_PEP_ID=MMETSP1081-20130531/56978_1 /TAXON_ID=36882 /ORGANISM="Pyramimonas amylifera, Strain CCMP720" /LENGTH=435 /DNA_ID=CAMNT_0041909415 /DNA_START=524 /DNA_END=1831 /DNA_ORIENTATION=-
MVGDFGVKVADPPASSTKSHARAKGASRSHSPPASSSNIPYSRKEGKIDVGEVAKESVSQREDSTAQGDGSTPEDQMLARERAAEKVVAEQKEKLALVHGQSAPPNKGSSPKSSTIAKPKVGIAGVGVGGASGPVGGTSAASAAALAASKKAGKKEEGASWSVLDNLRMVSDGTRLVTHKRQFIVFNETLNHTVLRHWLEYVDGNETLIYHFPRSLFELLPLEEPQWHFKTCAVVGNSGVVLLRENGAEIDAHDAVLRINMAPVRGFEHYVGKKTTYNIVNSHNVRELLQGLRHWTGTPEGESRLVMFETASHFARYHLCQPLLKKFPQANPILLNPIFSNRAHRVWVQLKYLLEQKENNQYNRKPMSGFFAVFFALNVCDKVDLYGFDAYTSKKRSYRYHYFDNVQGFTDVHSFDLAIEVYKLFAQRGLVSIIT